MIELKSGWWETKHIIFLDCGPLKVGAKTRLYKVLNRPSRITLGYIRWHSGWRKYSYHPIDSTIYDENCLFDIGAFTRERSVEYKAPGLKKRERQKMLERQIRYRQEKDLTNKQNGDSIDSVNEVVQPNNGLVEGSQTMTPLEVELGTISF